MLIFVLPAYNEAEGIGDLLSLIESRMSAAEEPYRVILVDDGSADTTLDAARPYVERIPLTLLRHSRNRGLGVAMWTGLSRAARTAEEGDIVITMDADCSHDPVLAPLMAERIRLGQADVVIASRFVEGGQEVGVPFHRRLLSRGARVVFSTLFRTRGVRDFSCGYRAYSASSLQKAIASYGRSLITESGFGCMVEILIHMRALGMRFTEAPLELRYDQKRGASKMRIFKTVRRYGVFMSRAMFLNQPPADEPCLVIGDSAAEVEHEIETPDVTISAPYVRSESRG